MMFSCNKCGRTIIQDDKGITMVGCEHYIVSKINIPGFSSDLPEGFESIFGNLKK